MTPLTTRILAGILSLLFVVAQPGQASPTAAPQAWNADKAKSRLGFSGSMNGQAFNGQFRRWDAQIRFDPSNLNMSLVRVSIETGSAVTGDQTRDEALPTADWFAVSVFPRATFVSRRFTSLGGGRYRVDGDLRIRNVSRPVSFPFALRLHDNLAEMSGRLSVDRTVFGVGQGQFKGTEAVAAKVDVLIAITASKATR